MAVWFVVSEQAETQSSKRPLMVRRLIVQFPGVSGNVHGVVHDTAYAKRIPSLETESEVLSLSREKAFDTEIFGTMREFRQEAFPQ